MFPSQRITAPSKQQGSMVIIAVLIATLLLALGVALSNVLSSSAKNKALEYYGARSFLAAKSGIQRYLNEVYVGAQGCGAKTYTFDAEQLANCTVSLSCEAEVNVPEPTNASGSANFYQLTSDATCETGQFKANRVIVIEVRQE